MNATKRTRNLKTPQPCRYCGFVSNTHKHERGYYGRANYSCRDASACGDRIRANKAAKGIPAGTSDLPF